MRATLVVIVSVMLMAGLCGTVVAGSLDSPGAPSGGSGMYTLQNLYDYLTSGTALTVQTGFQEPSAAPGSTMKTTKEIGDTLKSSFDQCNATTADNVELGKPFFCTVSGSWGVRTGTLVVPPTPTPTPTVTPTATWACGTAFTDSRDNKVYNTVRIGTTNPQCWMKENLNVGTKLASAETEPNTNDTTIEKWCYSNSDTDCTTYGGMYNWDEMMSVNAAPQGICPAGWHIPSNSEWCTLFTYLKAQEATCGCTQGDVVWECTPAGNELRPLGTSGFVALSAGRRDAAPLYTFRNQGNMFFFWTSTDVPGEGPHAVLSADSQPGVILTAAASRGDAYSVRCLKD
ncbi:MAG: hypothetical protein NTZ78_00785 [Candidatus Aureabacteria bacterium]|nr:hypothetical protein [Candidatus Auribacterota bacterium]